MSAMNAVLLVPTVLFILVLVWFVVTQITRWRVRRDTRTILEKRIEQARKRRAKHNYLRWLFRGRTSVISPKTLFRYLTGRRREK